MVSSSLISSNNRSFIIVVHLWRNSHRQYLDFGGHYDRDKLYWKEILDVVLSCACAPPGGGRNPLTARFVRHFAMFYISAPSSDAMKTIFKVKDRNHGLSMLAYSLPLKYTLCMQLV